MYSILIVDDEKIIREGISKMMPWKKLGISNVLMAEDGRQALEVAAQNQPDIILTDICMPDMDGLTFIKELLALKSTARSYDPRILVLTGHDRFDYAQQSCKLGVKDLLLKPVDEDVLSQVLSNQVEAVTRQRAEQDRQRLLELQLSRQAAQAHHMRLQQIVFTLVRNGEISGDNKKWLIQHEPRLLQSFRLACLRADEICTDSEEDSALNKYAVEQLCRQMIETNDIGIAFYHPEVCSFLLWFFLDDENRIIDVSDQLCSLIRREFNIKATAGLSHSACENSEGPALWLEAQEALNKGHAIAANVNMADDNMQTELLLSAQYKHKKQALEQVTDESQLQLQISELTELLLRMSLDTAQIRRECSELALVFQWRHLSSGAYDLHSNLPDQNNHSLDTSSRESFDRFLQDLTRLDATSACQRLNSFVQESLIEESDYIVINPIVQDAIKYIKSHLPDDLSVAGLAEQLHVSPNYLSRIFRQSANEGCNEYIVRKRMELAQTLLATTALKTYEVAEQVGYQDKNYFSLAFRKHTGQTPTDYRKQIQTAGR